MSKQDIIIVKEFNTWRNGGLLEFGNEGYPKRLSEALEEVVKAAERYEMLRTLNPREFKQLWKENINGYGSFDDLVDALIKARK